MRKLLTFSALVALAAVGATLWVLSPLRAAPEPRIALIIGNANYGPDIGQLKNPVNDARLMDSTLRGVGFQVVRLENVNRRQMRDAINAFGRRLSAAGPTAVGMFYYAGHGFQTGGRNWLVPVGAVVNSEADAEDETVRADYVLEQMDIARNQLNIMILDACRNNPFARSFRSAQRGLAPVQAPVNSVIGYATAPGDVAADGAGANSPYASALSAEIAGGSDPLEILMRKVTGRVKASTGNRQSPYVNSSLDREFRFRGPSAQPARPTTGPAPTGPSTGRAPITTEELELEAWRSLGPSPSQAELEAFLKAFPNGRYSGIAQAKLAELKRQASRPATQPSGPAPGPSGAQPASPTVQAGQTFRDCADCPEMVVVAGGQFMMGSPPGEPLRSSDEGPQHSVSISRFAVGKFEVTFAEWDACVAAGGCGGHRPGDQGWGGGTRPVVNVSWDDAKQYVSWLSRRTGKSYRLLTESEWEYAARAGTTTPYPWGSSASHEHANYGKDECCGGLAQGRDQWVNTSPAGSFPSNRFGLFDMHGNVREWTEDCWNDSYNGAPSDGRAWTSGNCSRRVLRGGSWYNIPQDLRSAYRVRNYSAVRNYYFGFRVARTL